jgi:drug/metabolite transporter (DMT)-like permease
LDVSFATKAAQSKPSTRPDQSAAGENPATSSAIARKVQSVSTTLTRPTPFRSASLVAWSALVVVWVVWGSTYLAIRVGVRTMPPFTMAAIRYVIAGAILLPIGWRSGTAAQRVADRPGLRQWGAMLLLGAMLPAFGNGVISWAEIRLPSGIAALLVGTVPLWIVVADGLMSRRMPGLARWLALAAGLVGVAVLSGGGASAIPWGATIAALLASMSWGTGSALQGRLPIPARPLLMAGMEMLCGGIVCGVIAMVRGELTFDTSGVSAESWWALVYLIGPGTLIAMTCYVFVLGRLSPTTVSSYAFVNPVVALLLGAVLLDERLTGTQVLGGAIVVLAVAGLLVGPRRSRLGP